MAKLIIFITVTVLYLIWGVVQAFNDNDWNYEFPYLLFKHLIYRIVVIGIAYFVIF